MTEKQSNVSEPSRRTLRKKGRAKRTEKLRTSVEFAKAWFEAKSKNSEARKVAFRKRYSKS